MAARQREGGAGGSLSVEAAHYYARIYAAARAGCLAELRKAGCGAEDAEDIFAATLERIMRKFDPADSAYVPAQMVTLLKKACRQKLIDERRHRDVLQLVPLADASPRFDAAESPAEVAEEREAVAIGREAIASLPERERALFFQRHRLNLTPDEILRRNPGLSRRTYRKVMQRANARALEAFGEIDSGARCAQMQREHLRRYLTGEAGEEELARVRAHLRHCRACRQGAAQMRGHLHDVASGLAAVLALEYADRGLIAGWAARLLDGAWRGGNALGPATRAGRERLREVALRIATALPGSGGEGAAGQLAGISAVKAASVCAAGAIAVGCLAAGAMPGIGALELTEDRPHSDPPRPAAWRVSPPPRTPSASDQKGAPKARPAMAPSAGKEVQHVALRKKTMHDSPAARAEPSPVPTESGAQVGTEVGAEAAGTGTPFSPLPTGSSGGGDALHGGGSESLSRGAGAASRGESTGGEEFGF